MEQLVLWEYPLRCMVEGRPTDFSVSFADGKGGIQLNRPTGVDVKAGKATLEPLQQLLRSDIPIPRRIRIWLAEMMEKRGDTDFVLKISQRSLGRYIKGRRAHTDAALLVQKLIGRGEKYEAAVHKAMDEFGIRRTTVTRSYSELRKVGKRGCDRPASAYSDHPIPANATATLELVVQILRSEATIPRQKRNWLADMIDKGGDADFVIRIFRRFSGRYIKGRNTHTDAGLRVEELIDRDGCGYELAVYKTMKEFKLGRTTVTRSYSNLKKVRNEEYEVCIEAARARLGC